LSELCLARHLPCSYSQLCALVCDLVVLHLPQRGACCLLRGADCGDAEGHQEARVPVPEHLPVSGWAVGLWAVMVPIVQRSARHAQRQQQLHKLSWGIAETPPQQEHYRCTIAARSPTGRQSRCQGRPQHSAVPSHCQNAWALVHVAAPWRSAGARCPPALAVTPRS
jgi:hypothetical protein